MNSSDKFKVWLRENEKQLSKLENPHLAIFQRNGEISCIDDPMEVKDKIKHHLKNLEDILVSYNHLHMPLTPEGKRLYGNERQRTQAVRGFPIHVRTRLEPVLSRSDVFDPTTSMKSDFEGMENIFHSSLDRIDTKNRRNQDRWPLYLESFDDFRCSLDYLIHLIKQKL